jgi:hypothetical protein
MTEAIVSDELGVTDLSLGSNSDGTRRTYQQVYNAVKTNPMYR